MERDAGGDTEEKIRIIPADEDSQVVVSVCQTAVESPISMGKNLDADALRVEYEKLRLAQELSLLIGMERDLQSLLDGVIDFCLDQLPADDGVVLLADSETGELAARASRQREAGVEGVRISTSVLDRVRNRKEALLVVDARAGGELQHAPSIRDLGIRSVMAVPLLVRGAVLGVLFLDNCRRPGAFSERDLRLLTGIAGQASVAMERMDLMRQVEAEAQTRAHLARFLSPVALEQVQRGALALDREGEFGKITVLFSDIRGFTRLSERVGPRETVRLLNAYFHEMVAAVFRFGGMLDKFVGDGLFAVWGAPQRQDDDEERACRCALEMQERMERLNRRHEGLGREVMEMGIGINSGEAVVGLVGSPSRMEYTVIGDVVNVASRLCSLARGGQILATERTLTPCEKRFSIEPRGPIQVRGKQRSVSICRVMGLR